MDLNFVDPSEAPVPPEELQLKAMKVEPFPDQRRIKVRLELSPFQQRPTLVVAILDKEDQKVATTSIIESIDNVLEFTMHLPGKAPPGQYRLRAAAGYEEEEEPVDVKEVSFQLTG
jgi:hypothetical protein